MVCCGQAWYLNIAEMKAAPLPPYLHIQPRPAPSKQPHGRCMGRQGSKEEAETPREGLTCQPHTRKGQSQACNHFQADPEKAQGGCALTSASPGKCSGFRVPTRAGVDGGKCTGNR